MTAVLTPSVCCDDCGVIATGAANDTVAHLRMQVQQGGWETLRVGNGMRDYCTPCSLRRRREAA